MATYSGVAALRITAPRALAVPIFLENYEKYAIEIFFFLYFFHFLFSFLKKGEKFSLFFMAPLNQSSV